jgi:hypothetical protein
MRELLYHRAPLLSRRIRRTSEQGCEKVAMQDEKNQGRALDDEAEQHRKLRSLFRTGRNILAAGLASSAPPRQAQPHYPTLYTVNKFIGPG